MRLAIAIVLLLGLSASGWTDQKTPPPAACQDEEAMAADYKKSLGDLVGAVKKENLPAFQHDFHRKNCLTKLGLYANILTGVTACFDTAVQDSATPKQQVETYKAKRDAYNKAKEDVSQYRDSLKKVEAEGEAKKLIEKMEFAD